MGCCRFSNAVVAGVTNVGSLQAPTESAVALDATASVASCARKNALGSALAVTCGRIHLMVGLILCQVAAGNVQCGHGV